MTKKQFYNDPDVQDMADWMADRFCSKAGWKHKYPLDDKKYRKFNSLYDAYDQYEWDKLDKLNWKNTKKELDVYRDHLRKALKNGDTNCIIIACKCILRWGGVSSHNTKYLNSRQNHIIPELKTMYCLLSNNQTPSKSNVSKYRMNAGFSKIYSLLCDYCIMYDSRVAAALGLLVRQFCENKKYNNHLEIPDKLKFAYLDGRIGNRNRNPNLNNNNFKNIPLKPGSCFPKLSSRDYFHYTENIMKASWLLELALHKNPNRFSNGQDGFHELAAGLFMIGEDLD